MRGRTHPSKGLHIGQGKGVHGLIVETLWLNMTHYCVLCHTNRIIYYYTLSNRMELQRCLNSTT